MVAALPAFVLSVAAWPEMVVPAWAMAHGAVLYESTVVAYTPGLILALAVGGKVFGFGPALFRALAAISLAGSGALLVFALLRRGGRMRLLLLFGVALPLLVLWTAYFDGPALSPDFFVGPLLLGAGLTLEPWRHVRAERRLVVAGLLLGLAVLVKQTAAFPLAATLLWCATSRRRSASGTLRLAAAASAPYALFVVVWGALFRTTAHVRWTLLIPLLGHAGEIAAPPDAADLLELVAPYLAVVSACAAAALRPRRASSPLPFLAVGIAGMAWPRWDLLHFAPLAPIVALLAARTAGLLVLRIRRRLRPRTRSRGLVLTAVAAGLLLAHVGVALFGAGPQLRDSLGAGVRFWDEPEIADLARSAEARVGRGGRFLNVFATYDTIYPRSGTTPPGNLYVNTAFWFLLNKDRLDERLIEALTPGTLVLAGEPHGPLAAGFRRTRLFRFLGERTELVERIDERTSWRRVVEPP